MTYYDGYGNVVTIDSNGIEYKNPNLIDVNNISDIGYGSSNDGYNEFGSAQYIFKDYIDVTENKEIYMRICLSSSVEANSHMIACYDSNKNYLYTINRTDGYTQNGSIMRSSSNITLDDETSVTIAKVIKYIIPSEVSYIRCNYDKYYQATYYQYTIISYTDIKYLCAIENQYPSKDTYSMLMIGDSLTNWGGGNDFSDGFLKVVHDKTNVATTNEGMAGAWWQTGDGQTYCGVNRVNTLISEQRKYDLYCFLLGTNQGSNTDTGETSADTSTMSGAIRYCLETLKKYQPTAKIIVCLPPQRAEGNENQEKVNEVIKSIVESYGVKTLDIYHNGGIVPNTKIADINYLTDGLHLDVNGYTVLGNLLASEVAYLLGI